MAEAILGRPAADNFLIRGTPNNRGTVLKLLLDRGVQETGDPTQCHAVAIDARAPKYDGGIITRLDCVIFGIVVNKHAQRFYDEGEDIWPKRYAIWGRLVAAQPDQIAYIIFDAAVVTMFMPSLYPPIGAPSIRELAGKLDARPGRAGGDGRRLQRRRAARARSTTRSSTIAAPRASTPPKTHWARRIETAPFYAYPVRPGITFTYLATRVNREARMLMARRQAVGEHVRRRRDHGRQRARARLRGRHRHDDRQRVRPHRRQGGGGHARN